MGVVDRRRHQRFGLAAGVAEHDALVAGALVLVAGGVDADGDVGGLRVDQDLDVGLLPVEAGLLVADILDRMAGGGFDQLMGDRVGSAHFAGEHELVGRGQGLDRDAGVRVHDRDTDPRWRRKRGRRPCLDGPRKLIRW